jgi:threonylcarbamoyladenosine tRNA methylthiotransferase MtaB
LRVLFKTFGCKANQYDTERMRQELEALGARSVAKVQEAQLCVLNTCTVTSQADADARRFVRRARRENPDVDLVVAGCSSALDPQAYREMDGVVAVVEGHDPVEVARAAVVGGEGVGCHPTEDAPERRDLVSLGSNLSLSAMDREPVGGELLRQREGGARGWLKIQDGCDRKCSFCATRLARGSSRSRPADEIIAEARLMAATHPELVLTGIHVGHYGRDLGSSSSLSRLTARLLDQVPDVRFRLGSVEATEVDDLLLELFQASGGRLAPHLHMPMQSGSDAVLRGMRRWHTRDAYRERALEIGARFPVLGLGADIITGFPGETDEDHDLTRALVEELPFTYLHVFPYSPRRGTPAADLPEPVPQRIAGERARELRELALEKGRVYREGRIGQRAEVVLEGEGGWALTEDYLRVASEARGPESSTSRGRILSGRLQGRGEHLYIDLSRPSSN